MAKRNPEWHLYRYRKNPSQLLLDLPKIFELIGRDAISPVIAGTFDLLEARESLMLLASGSVEGKLVLTRSSASSPQ